ncbi:cysteine synthase A [Methanococcus vannielii SB]|uniref:cysteine synthase n=1 Tax=Methanococcus vannielii (strain ATCC 35089 / DSM 1224 / JCM 13029 / OCM 148 / SB) TaxID=406327 RepID=A6UNL7_METVS|nr:cysteine synthase A [Methanococcus vannielii]ABR54089.1 cysteine synthase A [Methanococcus vannielii SB]
MNNQFRNKIYGNIIETIGNTPIVRLNKIIGDSKADILVKIESFNPLGSVKDRIGDAMIKDGEKKGIITKNSILIEPTSGNTGVALAFVAAAKGHKLIITMPETMSIERQKLLKILGAKVVLTPGVDGMQGAILKANDLLKEIPNSVMLHQFENEANPKIHEETTAKEILVDTGGKIDILVAGVGTGGTLTGISRAIKKIKPELKVIAVEPLSSQVLSGKEKGAHKIQGIGAGFIPKVLDTNLIDEIIPVSDENAVKTMFELAKKEGILTGISSGAALYAALKVSKRYENEGKIILVILPDTGERYLSMDWLFADTD